MSNESAVRLWLGLAAIAVLAQESLTVYQDGAAAPHLLWGGLSLLLLYRVYRGGSVARVLFLGLALLGAVVYGLQIGSGLRPLLLAPAYAVQAAAMLMPAVRGWTRRARSGPATQLGAA